MNGTLLLNRTSIATKTDDGANKTYKLIDSINNYDEIIIYAHIGSGTTNRDVCNVHKLPPSFFTDNNMLNIHTIGGALNGEFHFYCENISINGDTLTRYSGAFSSWSSSPLYIEIYGKKYS